MAYRRAYLLPHLFQFTRRKLGWFFLYIDLKIRYKITSSWNKSSQQTAFNHTSGRPTLNADLVSRSYELSKIVTVLNTCLIVH